MSCVSLAVVGVAGSAWADHHVRLAWSAPGSCPTVVSIHEAVARYLPADRLAETGVRVRADVVESDHSTYLLTLTLETASSSSTEEFRASSCSSLADLVALKAALLIDSLAVATVTANAARAPTGTPAEETVGTQPPRASTPAILRAGVHADGVLGLWQHAAPGLAATLSWERHALALAITSRYLPGQTVSVDAATAAGVRLSLWAGAVRACALPRFGVIELAICGGLEAGMMSGEGRNLAEAQRSRQPWLAASVGPSLMYPLGQRIRIGIHVDAVAQLRRVSYRILNLEPPYTTGRVALRLSAGIDLRFR